MKKVLFDTNIILDVALKRIPFFQDAYNLFPLIDKKIITANITATRVTDIYFISKKEKGHNEAILFIENLLELVDVIGVDREIIFHAISPELMDFEDAIQIAASESDSLDAIITRNKTDFTNTSLDIFSPKNFLESLKI